MRSDISKCVIAPFHSNRIKVRDIEFLQPGKPLSEIYKDFIGDKGGEINYRKKNNKARLSFSRFGPFVGADGKKAHDNNDKRKRTKNKKSTKTRENEERGGP